MINNLNHYVMYFRNHQNLGRKCILNDQLHCFSILDSLHASLAFIFWNLVLFLFKDGDIF